MSSKQDVKKEEERRKEEDRKRVLRRKIEYQVKCEERAHRIVERLIDNPVSEELLLDSVRYIGVGHYGDITEERAISKLCGYPVCLNRLGNVPKQKYSISTKTNKVYNIENRKNFCSGKCYQASRHLEKQISTTPLWSRKEEHVKPAVLLSLEPERGILGDEVLVSAREELSGEVKRLEHIDKYHSALQERQQKAKAQPTAELEESDDSCVYTLEKAVNAINLEPNNHGEETSVETVKDDSVNIKDTHETGDRITQSCIQHNKTSEQDRLKHNASVVCKKGTENIPVRQSHHETISEVKVPAVEDSSHIQTRCPSAVTETSKSKTDRTEADALKAKTDHLMKLLNKRKTLLSKMADIQPTVDTVIQDKPKGREGEDRLVVDQSSSLETRRNTTEKYITTGLNGKMVASNLNEKGDTKLVMAFNSTVSECKIETIDSDVSYRIKDGNVDQRESGQTIESCSIFDNSTRDTARSSEKVKDARKEKLSTLEVICRSIHGWITAETVEYLDSAGTVEDIQRNSKFDKQYRALVDKVDSQEMDFSELLGEETMDETSSQPSAPAPAPHFGVLKEETEQDSIRVHEFLKGSFTYTVQERSTSEQEDEGSKFVLPSVDRYNQLLIRQRIVLERISKVLPNVLSPLHLLVQDVYTELKNVVLTFNLTRENILFRPSEWTLVVLLLLKLISRKLPKVQETFTTPSAEKFFSILLKGIGSDMSSLDILAGQLIQKRTKTAIRKK